MLAAFEKATDRLFNRLGVQAVYHPHGSSESMTLQVILKIPDHLMDFQAAQVLTATQVIDVKCSDVTQPKVGDVIQVNQTQYTVQSEPVRDQHGLIWKLDVIKACDFTPPSVAT